MKFYENFYIFKKKKKKKNYLYKIYEELVWMNDSLTK